MKKLLCPLFAIFLGLSPALHAAAERDPVRDLEDDQEQKIEAERQELQLFASMAIELLQQQRDGLDAFMAEHEARRWEKVGRLTLFFIEQGKNPEEVRAALALCMKDDKKKPSAWFKQKQEESNKKVQDFLAHKTPELRIAMISKLTPRIKEFFNLG